MRNVPSVRAALAIALAIGLTWLAGCRHPTERQDHCSGDVAALGDRTGTLHVRAELTHGGQVRRHEAIVQIRPGTISLVGLTPMGTQAFELTHGADGLAFENRIGRFLGMTPRLLYDAVARSFLASGASGAGGAGGERLLETWHAGRRERRRFLPLSERDRGAASVTYAEPASAVVHNEWCGYEARIVVVSDDRPDAASP